ncbi:MAG: TetR/AcrR family transcriptional regulator [Velocimicrobium sp.]
MAVADKTIDPRILDSARKEFLKYGFERASLKNICTLAGVTTGALYKRYAGKDELFCAVVKQTMDDLTQVINQKLNKNLTEMSDQELIDVWYMDEDYMMWWFDFLNQRYDDFVLLLKCASGSSYYDFANTWVEQMNQATYSYYEEAYRRKLVERYVDREEMHILITAFWTTIYEPFIHGMDWAQIREHCNIVCKFFDWHSSLGFIRNVKQP